MLEGEWHAVTAGKLGRIIAPRATFWAHPSHFSWQSGRLNLRVPGGVMELPPHKFLIGIHKAKAGSALGGAMLRPLAWWWCAANFASDWLLNLAQLFGLPFRWANHDPNASQETVDAICNMLQNMGSAGWAAFPAGTTLDLKDVGASGDRSPQGDLLDRADRYARMLILGQTMSGSQDSSKGGGKAFGAVEAEVKNARTGACAKYVCETINSQLIPSTLQLNYGDCEECPCMDLVPDSEAGGEEAKRDTELAKLMPIPLSYLRAKYNVPEAAKDEETTMLHAGKTQAPREELKRQDAKDAKEEKEPIEEDDYDPKWEDSEDGQDIAAKMASLLLIDDDAIFAKQLTALTESLQ
jgi:phage gp29-like protein